VDASIQLLMMAGAALKGSSLKVMVQAPSSVVVRTKTR